MTRKRCKILMIKEERNNDRICEHSRIVLIQIRRSEYCFYCRNRCSGTDRRGSLTANGLDAPDI